MTLINRDISASIKKHGMKWVPWPELAETIGKLHVAAVGGRRRVACQIGSTSKITQFDFGDSGIRNHRNRAPAWGQMNVAPAGIQ